MNFCSRGETVRNFLVYTIAGWHLQTNQLGKIKLSKKALQINARLLGRAPTAGLEPATL